MSCYVEYDRINKGRKSLSLCGEWTDERDISADPTCELCQAELRQTGASMFGETAPGTPVHSTLSDPLKGYREKTR